MPTVRYEPFRQERRPKCEAWIRATLILCALPTTGCHLLRRHPVDFRTSMAREMTFNGIDAMQRGRTAEAQNLFSRAAEAAPDDQRIRLELARSYLKNGQIHQAIAQMREAVRLSGGEAVYHIELGQLYAQTGQWELAREQAALALDNNRRLASAWALKGHVEQSMGELDAARISLSRALAHDPDLVAARFQLAQVYQRLGRPQRTLSVLESLMRQSGPDEVPQEQLLLQGIALAQIGQLDRSAWVLALAAERSEPLPDTLLELARVHVQRGDFANARRVLVRGREMFAKRPEFGTRLAELAANGDPNVQASF